MRTVAAGLLGLAILTGCGGPSDDTSAPNAESPSSTTPTETPTPTATPSPTPTPSAKPTPTPTPKPAPVPTARDGSNLSACRDGRCQVLVKPNTTVKFNGGKIVIGKIDKFAHFTLTGDYGGGNGQLGPNCAVTFGYGGLSTRCGATTPAPVADDPPGLTLRVPYVGKGRAILSLNKVG